MPVTVQFSRIWRLNCASIPEDAVESEPFYHAPKLGKRLSQANGGSVPLDEIRRNVAAYAGEAANVFSRWYVRRVGEDHEIFMLMSALSAPRRKSGGAGAKATVPRRSHYRLQRSDAAFNLPPLRDWSAGYYAV